jgi:hypothetical protein
MIKSNFIIPLFNFFSIQAQDQKLKSLDQV